MLTAKDLRKATEFANEHAEVQFLDALAGKMASETARQILEKVGMLDDYADDLEQHANILDDIGNAYMAHRVRTAAKLHRLVRAVGKGEENA